MEQNTNSLCSLAEKGLSIRLRIWGSKGNFQCAEQFGKLDTVEQLGSLRLSSGTGRGFLPIETYNIGYGKK